MNNKTAMFNDETNVDNKIREKNKKRTVRSHSKYETNGPKTINGIIANKLLVNVRKEPRSDADVLGILNKGDRVTIIEKKADYYKIYSDDYGVCYISSNFIIEEDTQYG